MYKLTFNLVARKSDRKKRQDGGDCAGRQKIITHKMGVSAEGQCWEKISIEERLANKFRTLPSVLLTVAPKQGLI
ncbi:hypothetical protein RRG08_026050 [Elysia crispata]|uniref:Uncharacterized protein n=1 Tax=Elysia crispata TaxID=231223 RepID=A0AAE0YZT1_9GAST|nr:hypothetical protein RRG08_026050 [Elysia crispata]